MLLLLALLALADPRTEPPWATTIPAGTVATEVATTRELAQRTATAPADLVLFAVSEHRGSLEPCACVKRPRGSLARFLGYVVAARDAAPAPSLVAHGGYWLADAIDYAGQLRREVALQDQWMFRAMREVSWSAINVTAHDVAGLVALRQTGVDVSIGELPLVSAHISGPGIEPYRVVDRGGVRVGFTGLSGEAPSMADLAPYSIRPSAAAKDVIEELRAKVDVLVILSWTPTGSSVANPYRKLADVVIDANQLPETLDAVLEKGTLTVFPAFQGVRATEVRLDIDNKKVVGALDRAVDLDSAVPSPPAIASVTAEARREIDALKKELYGP